MGKVHVGRSIRTTTGGDHKVLGADRITVIDCHRVLVDEMDVSPVNVHLVAIVERLPHRDLLGNNRLCAAAQLFQAGAGVDPQFAKHRISQSVHGRGDCVAQRFAGDRAPMSTAAANLAVFFCHGDAQAVFGRLHRGALASGAGSNYKQVVVKLGVIHSGSTFVSDLPSEGMVYDVACWRPD